jgi:general secretion pathway protein D
VNQLDVMPLQVLVDATIVEVTLTDNLKYGIQWYFNHSNGGQNIVESNDLGALAAGAATGGFGYSFLSKSGDIKAVLNAEASNNNVNVISSPSLMVLNNQEASIQVGKEISLMTGSLGSLNNTNTTGSTSNNVFSQQQQRKTGVKLKIKPRVNANGLVTMEVTQSVEDPGAIPANGTNPSILTREINSSVAVQSGETIVLGGLIKDNNTDDNNGIPLLHDVPILGTLFGSKTRTKDKTELVVLITPRVVKSRQDAGLITDEFKRKLSGIYENNLDDLPQ